MQGLDGKVAIVTGATKDMGEAIAARLGREGVKIVGCGRTEAAGEAVADRLRADGVVAHFVPCDVSQEQDVRTTIDTCIELHGRLDIVINNAGAVDLTHSDDRPVVDADPAVFERILRINLGGPFWFFKHAIPHMQKIGGGAFVNLSSIAAQLAVKGLPAYGTSKAALEALSRQVAIDYAEDNIRSNSILVGRIDMPSKAEVNASEAGRALLQLSMLPRFGTTSEVASMVAFLASDEASFVTGSVVALDGGTSSKLVLPDMRSAHDSVHAVSPRSATAAR